MKRDELSVVILAVVMLSIIIIWGVLFVLPGLNPNYRCCMQICEKAEDNMEEFMVFTGVSIPAKMNCEDYCKTIAEKFEGVFFDEEISECKEPFSLGDLT